MLQLQGGLGGKMVRRNDERGKNMGEGMCHLVGYFVPFRQEVAVPLSSALFLSLYLVFYTHSL